MLLDAMGDGTSVNWAWVQPEVGRKTRTCAYYRAGRGWNERSSKPRDAVNIAAELHTLLANAHIDPPYVMVGHSFGAFITREYAADFPDQVAGAVIIDGGQPEIRSARMTEKGRKEAAADDFLMSIAPILARLGVFRLMGGAQKGLPPQERAAYAANYASSRLWDSMYEEQLKALPATDEQVRRTGEPGSLVFDQHDASETSAQILRVVDTVRTGSRLDGSPQRPQ